MKHILFSAVAMVFMLQAQVFAQPGQRPSKEERIEKIMSSLNKELSLDSNQESVIKDALNNFFTEMDELHESCERPDMSKVKELETKRDAKVKETLSDDEYETFLSVMEASRPKKGGPPPPRHK